MEKDMKDFNSKFRFEEFFSEFFFFFLDTANLKLKNFKNKSNI